MADTLTFYTNPMSRGRIARWMLEEVGQPYETVVLGYGTSMKAPDYLAINPMGKVPAIKHGDVVVTEGAAICAYLADAFPQAGLAPCQQPTKRAAHTIAGCSSPRARSKRPRATSRWAGKRRPISKRMVGYGSLQPRHGRARTRV